MVVFCLWSRGDWFSFIVWRYCFDRNWFCLWFLLLVGDIIVYYVGCNGCRMWVWGMLFIVVLIVKGWLFVY